MPTFTQKHYRAIAQRFAHKLSLDLTPMQRRMVREEVDGFAAMFKKDNARFKPHLFITACGLLPPTNKNVVHRLRTKGKPNGR